MRKPLDTLKDTILIIKKMGTEVGREISNEQIALKLKISSDKLEEYLNAEGKTPKEILTQLWNEYADLVMAVQRSNNSGPLRHTIDLVKRLGKAKGMDITDEEIVGKLSVPREQLDAYLNGNVATPDHVWQLFWSAWPDLLKNIHRVSSAQIIHIDAELDEEFE